MAEQNPEHVCSFCGNKESEVQQLLAGRGSAFICDECVITFHEMITGNPDVVNLETAFAQQDLPLDPNTELNKKLAELSGKYRIVAMDLAAFDLDPEVVKLIPKLLCMEHCIVPVNKSDNTLIVAIADPSTIDTVKKVIEKNTGLEIEFVVADKQAIIDKIPHDIH